MQNLGNQKLDKLKKDIPAENSNNNYRVFAHVFANLLSCNLPLSFAQKDIPLHCKYVTLSALNSKVPQRLKKLLCIILYKKNLI